MPEITVNIGGRPFKVACQPGEEAFLHSAADMLNEEANHLMDQIGQLPEARMLLMAGLLLADKTAGLQDQLRAAQAEVADLKQGAAAPAAVDLTRLDAITKRAETMASAGKD